MPTYCTDAQVTRWLPANPPDTVNTEALRLPYVTAASALVDGMVGRRFELNTSFQKFPDVTATPATPSVIQLPASMLGAWLILKAMGAANVAGKDPKPMWDDARRLLDDIRNGVTQVTDSAGTEYGTMDMAASTTEDYEPTFTIGGYDADGNLVSDHTGSLDDLTA